MAKFSSISVSNFMSIAKADLSYKDSGLVLVLGENLDSSTSNSNFSGKTNLMTEALSWALFGKGTKEVRPDGRMISSYSADSVIRTGHSSCEVAVEFSVGKDKYILYRTRSPGNPGLSLLRSTGGEFEDVSKPTVIETQKEIESVVGFNHATFTQTFFFGKGSARFSTATDSDRKDILEQVLGLGGISTALRKTNKRLRKAETEVGEKEHELREAESSLDIQKAKLSEAKKHHESWVSNVQDTIKSKKKSYKDIVDSINSDEVEKDSIQKEIDLDNRALSEANLEGLKHRLGQLEIEIRSGESESKVITRQVGDLTVRFKRLSQLKDSDCPVCGSLVTEESSESVKSNIIQELANLEIQDDTISESRKASLEEKKELETQIREVTDLRDIVREKRVVLGQLEKSIKDKTSRAGELQGEISDLANSDKEILVKINEHEEKCKDCEKLVDKKRKLLSESKSRADDLRFWSEGFGNRGIKYMMIREVLPFLTSKTNEYLSILAGPEYKVELLPESFTSKGETQTKLDVNIQLGDTPGYHAASGGERQRIDFCVSLALQSLQTLCSGASCNLFVLDEPFESIDETGVEGLIDLLKTFAEEHRVAIYVITHLDSLQSHFDNVLKVVKENGVSRMQV